MKPIKAVEVNAGRSKTRYGPKESMYAIAMRRAASAKVRILFYFKDFVALKTLRKIAAAKRTFLKIPPFKEKVVLTY